MPVRLLPLVLAGTLAACSSGSVQPPKPPKVTGASAVSVGPARSLCSGTPPTTAPPTARHTILTPRAIGDLRRQPDTAQTRKLIREYQDGLVGSGQTLKLLTEYAGTAVQVKVVVLSAGTEEYGKARLAFLCRSATGYVNATVTALHLPGFVDDLACFQDPQLTKPVLCAWYDDTAGTLSITGARGEQALDLAVAVRAALETSLAP